MAKKKARKSSQHGSPQTLEKRRAEKALRGRRRRRKRLVRVGAILALIVVAGSGALYAYNQRENRVRDLALVGTGVPAVVQVHDVTCPVCRELRSSINRIDEEFSDDELLIRIADISTTEGNTFARRYTTARRVTLLFIDGDGELVDVQTGVQSEEALRRAFRQHIEGNL